jgi:hypothetical protein
MGGQLKAKEDLKRAVQIVKPARTCGQRPSQGIGTPPNDDKQRAGDHEQDVDGPCPSPSVLDCLACDLKPIAQDPDIHRKIISACTSSTICAYLTTAFSLDRVRRGR